MTYRTETVAATRPMVMIVNGQDITGVPSKHIKSKVYKNKASQFVPVVSVAKKIRVDWPFYAMQPGESMCFDGNCAFEKIMFERACAARYHYERTRGFKFNTVESVTGELIIYRSK